MLKQQEIVQCDTIIAEFIEKY